MLGCEKSFAFVFIGNERLWISSKLVQIRFDRGRLHENPGYRHKKKPRKNTRQVTHMLIPLQGDTSETGDKSCWIQSS